MFDYTQAAAKQIAADFQKVLYIISVCSQAVYIGYLLYALFAGAGGRSGVFRQSESRMIKLMRL